MSVFDPIFAIYFLLYSLYSLYRLHFLLDHIKKFYDSGVLSKEDYFRLTEKYTGMLRYYVGLPDKEKYAALYEDAEFDRFCLHMRRAKYSFWATGCILFLWVLFT